MSASDYWNKFKEKGAKFTIGAILSAFIFGVIDSLTTGIIPYASEEIRYIYNPPRFYINFSHSLASNEHSASAVIYDLSSKKEMPIGEKLEYLLTVEARPGPYAIRISRPGQNPTEEIYAPLRVTKSEDIIQVDTSSSKWASLEDLQKPFSPKAAAAAQDEASLLTNTRWSVSQLDLTAGEGLSEKLPVALIGVALSEVGTFEGGTSKDKERIVEYWRSTGAGSYQTITADDLTTPWGGAFLAWAVRQVGLSPPRNSPAFRSWLNWGQGVPADQLKPGMIVAFRLSGAAVPESSSRLLLGVALKRQSHCIEVVTANIVDRVVITCVRAPIVAVRRAAASAE